MTSRTMADQREMVPGATGPSDAGVTDGSGAPGLTVALLTRARYAPLLLAVLLVMASVPVAAGESSLAVAIAAILSLAGGLSLRHPVMGGVIIGLTFTFAVFSGPAHVAAGTFASLVAIASTAGHGRLLGSIAIAIWHLTALTAIAVVRGDQAEYLVSELLLWIVLMGGAILAGAWGRSLFDRAVAERAKRMSDLSEQRRAIARELHDTGVRAMTEVVMLAENGALRHGTPTDTAAEFRRISGTARRAADEMRELLDQLRGPREVGSPVARPMPCLEEQLERIRCRLTASGFSVNVAPEGECPLPDEAMAVVVRCLEEMETNVVRHGDRSAPVAIMTESLTDPADESSGLRLVLLNGIADGDRHGLSGGAGLEGMRERLAAVGGHLEARPEGSTFLTRIDVPGDMTGELR